jgi:hypothetical protein
MSNSTAPPSSYPISDAGRAQLRRLGYLRLPDTSQDELPEVGPDLELVGGAYRTGGLLLRIAGVGSVDRSEVSFLLGLLRGARADQERVIADEREFGRTVDRPESEAHLAAIGQLLDDLGNTRSRGAAEPLAISDGERAVVVKMLDERGLSLRECSDLSLRGLVSGAAWLGHLLEVTMGDTDSDREAERDLVDLLRKYRKEALENADHDEHEKLPRIEAGNEDWYFADTQERSIELAKGYIERERRTVAVCDSVLALLTGKSAAVAA